LRGPNGALWLAVFLIVWVFVGGVMLAGGRWLRLTPKTLSLKVDSVFEFRLPDGEVVRSRDYIPAAALVESERPLPVVYDPRKPVEGVLLATLPTAVRVGAQGGWEASENILPAIRQLIVYPE